jgi:uncharacterized protein YdbL (DUF1318 family)
MLWNVNTIVVEKSAVTLKMETADSTEKVGSYLSNYLVCLNIDSQCLEELKSRKLHFVMEEENSTPRVRNSVVGSH